MAGKLTLSDKIAVLKLMVEKSRDEEARAKRVGDAYWEGIERECIIGLKQAIAVLEQT